MEKISSRTQVLGVIIIGLFLIFGIYKYYTLRTAPAKVLTVEVDQPVVQQPVVPSLLTIHVVGAVAKPGVYTLAEGQRINDAVELAEPTAKADLSLINLAAPLQDGRQIYVPTKGEKGGRVTASTGTVQQERGKININSASVAELDRLNGIGPALAQRIIEYRESQGPFTAIEEITKVNGIGAALLEKIKNDITIY